MIQYDVEYLSIHLRYPLIPELRVTVVSWILSQTPLGEVKVTP